MSTPEANGVDTRSRRRVLLNHLLTGLSYVVPFAILGGFLVALSARLGTLVGDEAFLRQFGETGRLALSLVFPALGGFTAYAIAGRPGLAPGFVSAAAIDDPTLIEALGDTTGVASADPGGVIAVCVIGLVTGIIADRLTDRAVPLDLRPVYPVLVVPLATVAIVAPIALIVTLPAGMLNGWILARLPTIGPMWSFAVGAVVGLMMAWDLGGPVNKIAYLLAIAAVVEGVTTITAAAMAAGMTPPLGFAVAAALAPDRVGVPAVTARETFMKGSLFITEGAIPYVERVASRFRPVAVAGSAVAGGIVMLRSVELSVPHGGILVIPLADDPVGFVVAVACGTVLTATAAAIWGEPT